MPFSESEDRRFATVAMRLEWRASLTQQASSVETAAKALQILLWAEALPAASFRAWGWLTLSQRQQLQQNQRFWGLFNLRPQGRLHLWLAWDPLNSELVLVKEVPPGAESGQQVALLGWEADLYQEYKNFQSRRTSGFPPLVASGPHWLANKFAAGGSLRWHLFPHTLPPPVQSLFQSLCPEQAFAAPTRAQRWRLLRAYFVAAAQMLHQMHQQGLVHRNLHPGNLLLHPLEPKNFACWIADWEQSRNYHEIFVARRQEGLHLNRYSAPERLEPPMGQTAARQAHYGNPQGDVYALAAVLCDCLIGQAESAADRWQRLQANSTLPHRIRHFLRQCLERDYHRRPDAGTFAQRLERLSWRQTLLESSPLWLTVLLLPLLFWFLYLIQAEANLLDNSCRDYVCLQGVLNPSAMHWTADQTYRLRGSVLVPRGVLRIDPGVRIVADSAATLIIGRDARIEARGTAEAPIVFTSARPRPQPGDWGGIIVLGKAPVDGKNYLEFCSYTQLKNQPAACYFGGQDAQHSSGILQYLIIAYAGDVVVEDQEVNGLTLAGVGAGTQVDHIAVYYANDDCFEFFGGTVQAKYLECHEPEDDGFDWESGYHGKLQFLYHTAIAPSRRTFGEKGRYGLEADLPNQNQPSPEIWNATLVGQPQRVMPQGGPTSPELTRHTGIHNLVVLNYGGPLPQFNPWKTWFWHTANGATNHPFYLDQSQHCPKQEITSWECPPANWFTPTCYAGAFRDPQDHWARWSKKIALREPRR